MRKIFIVIFGIFFLFLSAQSVQAASFWDYFNNNNYYYNNGYDYNNYDYYNNNNYDYNYTSVCPNMSYYDYYSEVCECYDGYIWYDYECISQYEYCQKYLGPNSRYEPSNNSCECTFGYVMEGQSCVYQSTQHNQERRDTDTNTRTHDKVNDSEDRALPTKIPPMNRNTPNFFNDQEDRPLPTQIPPMNRDIPTPPSATNIPMKQPTPWPSATPRPIPSWLEEYNEKHPTAVPTNTVVESEVPAIAGVATPTLIPATRPIIATTLNQGNTGTATQSAGFWQWFSSLFSKK